MKKGQNTRSGSVLKTNVLSSEAHSILKVTKQAKFESMKKKVLPETKQLFDDSKKYFQNQLAEFVYYRTYSRWIEDAGRRESWIETVDRYMNFMRENLKDKLSNDEYNEVREAILKQEAMPSMRLLQFAGNAARKTHVCAYNCSFIAPSKLVDFSEIMYILMCGTGVGYSVEAQSVELLPQIKKQSGEIVETHVVDDSREGWSDALNLGLTTWFSGKDIKFDFSEVRPYGARLKTMGGRASGPEPLNALLEFAREKIFAKQGQKLSNLDVHDLVCKIGEVVVSGGVRRSALISLSDLDDKEMREAKIGQFWNTHPERSMANNSAVYSQKPSVEQFLEEWTSLIKSQSGERGIFNRGGLSQTLPSRRVKSLKNRINSVGTNPCGEIILQSKQFCNLSEVVARKEDTEETLLRKIKIATILGTYQSTLTNFPYLSKEWKEHCEEERLLGVSVTGQWDCAEVRKPEVMENLKNESIKINKEFAERFGVNQSTCITCVKPSGNLSQTVNSSSGMHPRYAPYYIRRVRIASHDPLYIMLKDQGLVSHPEVGQAQDTATTWVLEFPVKAPEGSIYRNDMSAIEQLDYWKMLKEKFTEHNPSVTIYVGDDEWLDVANWVYKNWEIVGGISFLPRNNHIYNLAPYEEITEEKYNEMVSEFPELDFSLITAYEEKDETDNKKEMACVGGACEL